MSHLSQSGTCLAGGSDSESPESARAVPCLTGGSQSPLPSQHGLCLGSPDSESLAALPAGIQVKCLRGRPCQCLGCQSQPGPSLRPGSGSLKSAERSQTMEGTDSRCRGAISGGGERSQIEGSDRRWRGAIPDFSSGLARAAARLDRPVCSSSTAAAQQQQLCLMLLQNQEQRGGCTIQTPAAAKLCCCCCCRAASRYEH